MTRFTAIDTWPLLFVALLATGGCGMTRYGQPPRALVYAEDEFYTVFEVSWSPMDPSLGSWHGASLNIHLWWTLGDGEAMGASLCHNELFFFPDWSYAHWGPEDADGRRFFGTAHVNPFRGLMTNMGPGNPVVELALGAAHEDGARAQTLSVGAGFFLPATVLPSLRFVGQSGHGRLEVGMYPGRARHMLTWDKSRYLRPAYCEDMVWQRDEIASIDSTDFGEGRAYTFRVRDGTFTLRSPGGACAFSSRSPSVERFIDRFPGEPGARVWMVERGERDVMIEIDLEAALARFERDGVLDLRQDPACVANTLRRFGGIERDVSVGVSWCNYQNQAD